MFLLIFLIITALIAFGYIFLIGNFDYWKKLGIKSPTPQPFLGNYPSMLTQKQHMTYDLQDIYRKYKHTDNFVGIFTGRTPELLITDAELTKRILTTDFKHFHDNDISRVLDEKSDYLFGNNPFCLTGEKWKERRADMTPGLTVSRIKAVYPVTKRICENMNKYIEEQIKIGSNEGVNANDLCLRFTSEIVTDSVFGLEAKSFTSQPSPIRAMITKVFEQNLVIVFKTLLAGLFPSLAKVFKIRFFPKECEDFFLRIMNDSIELRKSQKQQGINENRNDFLNYMLQLQEKRQLSNKELTANSITFLSDGYETTAGVLAHTLLLLGRDLERQQKLREEIMSKIDVNDDFDVLMNLPYLNACIHESIRLFPPGFFTTKLCTEPIELLNKNGTTFTLAKNSPVVLPLHAIMIDEEFYTNPNDFEPERFLEENGGLKKYKDLGAYYGFSDGPRACLGMRFALAQMKKALADILCKFEVRTNPKTRNDNEFDPKYFLARLKGGIWLDFKKLA